MQDSPLGIRFADFVSAFPAGGTIAAAWDRGEWYRRGYQMGSEHRDKGVDVQLGPVVGPLGRNPKGGVSTSTSQRMIEADTKPAQLGGLFSRPIPLRYCGCRHCSRYPGCWRDCLHKALHHERAGALPPAWRC